MNEGQRTDAGPDPDAKIFLAQNQVVLAWIRSVPKFPKDYRA